MIEDHTPVSGASRLNELREGFGLSPFGATARPLYPPQKSPQTPGITQQEKKSVSNEKAVEAGKMGPSAKRRPQIQGRRTMLHAIVSEDGYKRIQAEKSINRAPLAEIVGAALENLTQDQLAKLTGGKVSRATTMPPSPGRDRMRRIPGDRDFTFAVTPEQRDWFEKKRSGYGGISMARLNGVAIEAYLDSKRHDQEGT